MEEFLGILLLPCAIQKPIQDIYLTRHLPQWYQSQQGCIIFYLPGICNKIRCVLYHCQYKTT